MNKEQAKSLARWSITLCSGTLIGWAVGTGWVDQETITSVLNSEAFVGIVASGITLVLGLFSHAPNKIVAAVAAIPDEKLNKAGIVKIITSPTPLGKALADATQGDVVTSATSSSPRTGMGL